MIEDGAVVNGFAGFESRKTSALLPWLVLFGLLGMAVAFWSFIDRRENLAIEALTRQFGQTTQSRIQANLDARVRLFKYLALARANANITDAGFNQIGSQLLRESVATDRIAWVDEHGILRWANPESSEDQGATGVVFPGFQSGWGKGAQPGSLEPGATQVIELAGGGRGSVATIPVLAGEDYQGRIIGIVRPGVVVTSALNLGAAANFEIRVSDGGIPIFETGWSEHSVPFPDLRSVVLLNREWILEVQPTPAYVKQLKPYGKQAVLGLGILASASIAYLVWCLLRAKGIAEFNRLRFQDFAESSSDWLWETDADLRLAAPAPGASGTFAGGPARSLAREAAIASWVNCSPDALEKFTLLVSDRKAFRGKVLNAVDATGQRFVLRLSGRPIVDERGQFAGFRGTGANITAEVQAEEAASMARRHLHDAIESLPAGFLLWDAGHRLVQWNSRVSSYYDPGMEQRLHVGMTYEEFANAATELTAEGTRSEREATLTRRLAAFRNAPSTDELPFRNGRTLQMIDWKTADGSVVSLRFDITERKQREEQLRQAQKMDALGKLTSGVAHDFNNLLQVILGNAEILVQLAADQPDLLVPVDLIQSAALRGSDLTSRLLTFSRKKALQAKPLDVTRLVAGMIELLRRTIGEHMRIETELAPGTWLATADASQLENALLNLAINARDAMPAGGKLTLKTSNCVLDSAYAAQYPDVIPGQYVEISVCDTGHGMDPETLKRAVEPFFTTKEVGKGTGLGLSMVFGFVQQSGGHIRLFSELGNGTTVKLYLPCTKSGASEGKVSTPCASPVPRGSEAVLVVEDDDLVRQTTVQQLVSLGYQVWDASDAQSALDTLKRQHRIRLLFTDIVMPGGMLGAELARHARAIQPKLHVLFTSGHASHALMEEGALDPDAPILTKPYAQDALARRLRAAFDGDGTQAD